MAGPIKAVGTCPMCGMEFEIKAAVEASDRNEAAVVYSVTVTRQGFVGKVSEIVIRAAAAPSRRDGCLLPGSTRFAACPSS